MFIEHSCTAWGTVGPPQQAYRPLDWWFFCLLWDVEPAEKCRTATVQACSHRGRICTDRCSARTPRVWIQPFYPIIRTQKKPDPSWFHLVPLNIQQPKSFSPPANFAKTGARPRFHSPPCSPRGASAPRQAPSRQASGEKWPCFEKKKT